MNKPPITVLEELLSDWTHGISSPTNRINALTNFADNQLQDLIIDLFQERSADKARIELLESELKMDGFEMLEIHSEFEKVAS